MRFLFMYCGLEFRPDHVHGLLTSATSEGASVRFKNSVEGDVHEDVAGIVWLLSVPSDITALLLQHDDRG